MSCRDAATPEQMAALEGVMIPIEDEDGEEISALARLAAQVVDLTDRAAELTPTAVLDELQRLTTTALDHPSVVRAIEVYRGC